MIGKVRVYTPQIEKEPVEITIRETRSIDERGASSQLSIESTEFRDVTLSIDEGQRKLVLQCSDIHGNRHTIDLVDLSASLVERVYIVHDDTDRIPGYLGTSTRYGYGIYDADTGELIRRVYGATHDLAETTALNWIKPTGAKIVELEGAIGDSVPR